MCRQFISRGRSYGASTKNALALLTRFDLLAGTFDSWVNLNARPPEKGFALLEFPRWDFNNSSESATSWFLPDIPDLPGSL